MTDRAPPKFRPMTQEERDQHIINRAFVLIAWLVVLGAALAGLLQGDPWPLVFFLSASLLAAIFFVASMAIDLNLTEDKPTEGA